MSCLRQASVPSKTRVTGCVPHLLRGTSALPHSVPGAPRSWPAVCFRSPHKPVQRTRRLRAVTVMVLTESKTLELGTKAPAFMLPEPLTGKQVSFEQLAQGAPATLVMFICNHCPFVVLLKEAIVNVSREYMEKGVTVVAISSNSIKTHPQDGPELMAEDAKKLGYPFPYLYDESQEVARQYKAACTPEFYVFDSNLELAYHGQFDDARPGRGVPVTGEDLRAALDDVLAGRPVQKPVKPSIGCNIKWSP